MELLYAAGIAVGLIVTTNIDDVFLLVGWFARGRPPSRQIIIGNTSVSGCSP